MKSAKQILYVVTKNGTVKAVRRGHDAAVTKLRACIASDLKIPASKVARLKEKERRGVIQLGDTKFWRAKTFALA